MPRFELLSPSLHAKLKIKSENVPHFTPVVTSEFFTAAASCPIMLTKEAETGRFYAGVVLSLKPGEPPLKTIEERGGFNPLSLQCSGFYISENNIVVDRDSPRFSDSEGGQLFTDSLQPGDNLRQIQQALGKYHAGIEMTQIFIRSLSELKLIEPVDMSLKFDNGERLTLQGLYTVSLDAIRDMDDATALTLFRAGHLELIYVLAASLQHFNVLAHLRNQQIIQSKKLN
ncbi:MAG TPA: SapC family protein [Cellvibrio sp.]|nr:SapC family protein [Cellvibrio sp.]